MTIKFNALCNDLLKESTLSPSTRKTLDSLAISNTAYSFHDIVYWISKLPEPEREEATNEFMGIDSARRSARRKQTIAHNSKILNR